MVELRRVAFFLSLGVNVLLGVLLLRVWWESRLQRPSNTAAASVRVEIRKAEEEPAPGLRPMKTRGSLETFYVHPTAELTRVDIKNAIFLKQYGVPALDIVFTEEGSGKIARLSRSRLRKRIAFLINGELLIAPVVTDPITDGHTLLSGSWSIVEARELATALNAK